MSVIWNNKTYILVNDDSTWDQLEYVVARKLHIQYKPNQKISINDIKKTFALYGAIQKIEIFVDNSNNIRFAHVTFKESRTIYFILIDFKQNPVSNIESMRPADAHQQPDNPVASTESQFYNLPDNCLLTIFRHCDINTIANLSAVCKKMSQLLRDKVLSEKFEYNAVTSNETEVINAMTTASRLIQCVDPVHFHVKIYRNLKNSHTWPSVNVNFVYLGMSKLSIERKFYQANWLEKFGSIAKRFKVIHARWTVYDIKMLAAPTKFIWPKATALIISGFSKKIPITEMDSFVNGLPNVESISIQNLFFVFKGDKLKIADYCRGKYLRSIDFRNCLFASDIVMEDIVKLVDVVKDKQNEFPLCVKFDRISYFQMISNSYYGNACGQSLDESSYESIIQATTDENIAKVIRFEIGKNPFTD